jgi:phosphatidylinositol-3-phosphatase
MLSTVLMRQTSASRWTANKSFVGYVETSSPREHNPWESFNGRKLGRNFAELPHDFTHYAEWAKAHNSLLIVTFDEDDDYASNHIATIIFGAYVRPGRYDERTRFVRSK